MAGLLKGTAFITGAASGIGQQTARAFAAAGVQRLALADINAQALTNSVASLQEKHANLEVMQLKMDVRDTAMVKAGIEGIRQRFGRIDIAVNNAGIAGSSKMTHETDEAEWLNVTNVMLNGVWRCQKEELAVMAEQEIASPREGRGCIINVASILGLVALESTAAYTSAKHGVVGLTRADALTYGPLGIRINAIAPGFTETPLLTADARKSAEGAAALDRIITKVSLGRMATVEEIADCIVFLASPMSSFVHGSVLVADGGYTAC